VVLFLAGIFTSGAAANRIAVALDIVGLLARAANSSVGAYSWPLTSAAFVFASAAVEFCAAAFAVAFAGAVFGTAALAIARLFVAAAAGGGGGAARSLNSAACLLAFAVACCSPLTAATAASCPNVADRQLLMA